MKYLRVLTAHGKIFSAWSVRKISDNSELLGNLLLYTSRISRLSHSIDLMIMDMNVNSNIQLIFLN